MTVGQRIPVVDTGRCSGCRGCVELYPQLFRMREDTGLIEVVDGVAVNEEAVEEVMKYCPEDCISWEGDAPAERNGR